MNDDDRPSPEPPAPEEAVWEAMDRFGEALRDLDEEVRALARLFERTQDRSSPPDDDSRIHRSLE